MTSSRRFPVIVLALELGLAGAVLVAPGCISGDSDLNPRWVADTTLVDSTAPDSMLRATVSTRRDEGGYILRLIDRLTDAPRGGVVSTESVHVAVGYHPHLVELVWSAGNDTAVVAIDSDFGDNIVTYSLTR